MQKPVIDIEVTKLSTALATYEADRGKRALEETFIKYLREHRPSLLKIYIRFRDQLYSGMDPRSINIRMRVLRGTSSLHYTCTSCHKPILSTTHLCSKSCVEQQAALRKALMRKQASVNATHATKKFIKDLQNVKSTYSVVRNVKGSSFKFIVRCSECNKKKIDYASYLIQNGCSCQRALKIQLSNRLSEKDFLSSIDTSKVHVLGKYMGANTRIKAKCLECSHVWKPFAANLKTHGCPVCAPDRVKANCLREYGVHNHASRPEIREKIGNTMMERYGVRHALQSKDLFEKYARSAYRHRPYRLGKRTVNVQGYEPKALDYILRTKNVVPADIECGIESTKVPRIPYRYNKKDHIYHPDIFIPKLNRIIEVKSEYTYAQYLAVNLAKRKACLKQGYKFTFLIMDRDGTRILNER